MIRRAVCISVQTKQTAIYNEIQGWFNDFIFTKASRDESGFALRVMELFFEQKNFNVSIILNATNARKINGILSNSKLDNSK